MLLPAVRTSEQMAPALTAAALTDGAEGLAVHRGDTIPEARQVLSSVITEDLLNTVHDSTPRTNWLSFSRDCSRPLSVTCR